MLTIPSTSAPDFAQSFHDLDHAAARRDQIFDDDDLLPRFEFALDAVLSAVILCARADVAHRQSHQMRRDRRVGDARRAKFPSALLPPGYSRLISFRSRGFHDLSRASGAVSIRRLSQ